LMYCAVVLGAADAFWGGLEAAAATLPAPVKGL
jgi:hypothetical protein